jgi:hypothetical protein
MISMLQQWLTRSVNSFLIVGLLFSGAVHQTAHTVKGAEYPRMAAVGDVSQPQGKILGVPALLAFQQPPAETAGPEKQENLPLSEQYIYLMITLSALAVFVVFFGLMMTRSYRRR